MAATSFSLTEKLAVTGAFLALVALAVGTEDDPGVVVTSPEAVKELRRAAPAATPSAMTPTPLPVPSLSASEPMLPAPPPLDQPLASGNQATGESIVESESDEAFSPELGRVPRDFSRGPPET